MDPIHDQQMSEILKLTQENNVLLKKINQRHVVNSWIRIGYWVFIILISYGGYVALKPTISSLLGTYSKAMDMKNVVEGSGGVNIQDLGSLLEQFK